MATGRRLQVSVKGDVWDFGRVLSRGHDDVAWHVAWGEYSQRRKRNGGKSSEWKKLPSNDVIHEYMDSDKEIFYSANGGDYVAKTEWLEEFLTAQGKGPPTPGDWVGKADMCIARGEPPARLPRLPRGRRRRTANPWTCSRQGCARGVQSIAPVARPPNLAPTCMRPAKSWLRSSETRVCRGGGLSVALQPCSGRTQICSSR